MTDQAPASSAGDAAIVDAPLPTILGADFSNGYRTYVLVVMTLVYVVNYLDRQIIGILGHQIKLQFHLSDFQLGILNGPAFVVIYAVLGIPIAIFADRLNRRNLIAASIAVFSVMTILTGYVANFWQLAAARFGTGVGEAGTTPSINSLLADIYPPEKRASALAFYSAGLNIGLLIAFFGGGYVGQHYGWQKAFLVSGLPGLLLVILIATTIHEPKRGIVEKLADTEEAPSLWAVIRHLWSQRSFRWISIGAGLSSFGGYAGIAFIPTFFQVSHHMTLLQVSVALALSTGLGGAIGTYMSGFFADLFGKKDVRYNLMVPIVTALYAAPFVPILFLTSDTRLSLFGLYAISLVGAAYIGPTYAMTQALVPLRMRARAIAIFLFVLNMIGLNLGPPVIGFLSDILKPHYGADSLRFAFLATILTGLSGAFCYWRSTKTLKADIARASAL